MHSISLRTVAAEQLSAARQASTGRAAYKVYGGTETALRQQLIALTAGRSLADHDNSNEATLHVLHGHVRLTTPAGSWEGSEGDHVVIPKDRHGLTAIDDSVVLLTVVAK